MTDRSVGQGTELRRMERVYGRWQAAILEAVAYSSVPAEFLGALTANESAGDPKAARFEPRVYDHLKAVASGNSTPYNSLRAHDVTRELGKVLYPKADGFHAGYLGPGFAAEHGPALDSLADEALRELATSWGLTQIMGYHLVGRTGMVRDLIEPGFHYRLAVELLGEFAGHFDLDLGREWAEMFRCWNTGSPYGVTFDPNYVVNGLRRAEIYRELAKGNSRMAAPELEARSREPGVRSRTI